ncbi:MAG: helix-turn-helix domain-containing protein [Methylocella sp.]
MLAAEPNRAERRKAAVATRLARDPLPLDIGGNYPIPQAARIIGVSRSTIYNLMAAEKLRSVKIAGRRLITADAIRALISGGE